MATEAPRSAGSDRRSDPPAEAVIKRAHARATASIAMLVMTLLLFPVFLTYAFSDIPLYGNPRNPSATQTSMWIAAAGLALAVSGVCLAAWSLHVARTWRAWVAAVVNGLIALQITVVLLSAHGVRF